MTKSGKKNRKSGVVTSARRTTTPTPTRSTGDAVQLAITKLRVDGGTQPRAELDELVIDDYADALKAGAAFPPGVAYYDGAQYWLADGFHRREAHERAGRPKMPVDVRQGTQRDARLYSVGANAQHGLKRSNQDKRRAVMTLLEDGEWTWLADREIARLCCVSHTFVATLRDERVEDPSGNGCQMRSATRKGKQYTLNVAGIGTTQKLTAQAREKIRHTDLAEDRKVLRDLAQLPEEKQVAATDLLLTGKAKTVAQAERALGQKDKSDRLRAAAAIAPAAPAGESAPFRVITGDCLLEMPNLTQGKIKLVAADPPYNEGIDYGDGEQADKLPDDEYLDWTLRWMIAAKNLLTDDGSLWVLISPDYADNYGLLLREAGLYRRNWITWYESFGVNCIGNFNRCSRFWFYCTKDPDHFVFNDAAVNRPSDRQLKYNDQRANPAGKNLDNVWFDIPRLVGNAAERIPDFPTQLPSALLRRVIGCATDPGDQVVDPFGGSGTTAAAALELGRTPIIIEKNTQFAEWSELRLRTLAAQLANPAPERKLR